MKFKFFLFAACYIPTSMFAQLNYGLSASAGSSILQTGNTHAAPGEFFQAGVFGNYTDSDLFTYEAGLYYQVSNQKLDQFSKEFVTDISWIRYHYSEIKLPVTIGIKIHDGIFKTFNLLCQAGVYGAYGVNGHVSIWNIDKQGQTVVNEAQNPYYRDIFHNNGQQYNYQPLKRADFGTILRIGTAYKRYTLMLNSENGYNNLNNDYDKFFRNRRVYISLGYNFKK